MPEPLDDEDDMESAQSMQSIAVTRKQQEKGDRDNRLRGKHGPFPRPGVYCIVCLYFYISCFMHFRLITCRTITEK